jgi:opacity protein-like surface antigen
MLLAILSTRGNSQSVSSGDGKWEAGLSFGPMFFLGDLGGSAGIGKPFVKDLDFPLTNLSKTIYAAYYPSELFGFRLAINHGVLKGDDAKAPNKGGAEVDRLQRNLSFKSSILEAHLVAEIYPTVLFEQYDEMKGKLRPYVLGGIGYFHMNPKAKLNGEWVALQPLHLEGQGFVAGRKDYKLWNMELPFGAGIKYWLKENMYIGLEVMHRTTFTDYMDDVSTGYVDVNSFSTIHAGDPVKINQASALYYRGTYAGVGGPTSNSVIQSFQRGDPTENDAYFSSTFRIGWRLNSAEDQRSRRQLRCPVFY